MESKIKKAYLVKWYDMIVRGSSADIECDIEEIEEKFNIESSLFYTGKLRTDELVVKKVLLSEVKKAVQKPSSIAEQNYSLLMKSHGLDLKKLQEDLITNLSLNENVHRKRVCVSDETVESHSELSQLSLF